MVKLAFCGNDCSECPRYIATQSGDKEQLKEVAVLWRRVGYRDEIVSPEEIACHGCHSSRWCRYKIRECAPERGLDSCGECKDYPCQRILTAVEKTGAFAERIKEECPEEDYERLQKAFFSKKTNLDRVHSEHFKK